MYFVKDQYVVGTFDGTKKYAAEIFADTSNDLPAYNNCKSIDGEWHKQGEEPDSTKSSLNSVSPALVKTNITPDEKSLEDTPEEYYTEDSEPLTKVSDEDAELL